jgi:hypothetical protein
LFSSDLLLPVLRDVIRDYVPNPKAWQYVLLGVSGKKRFDFFGVIWNAD